MNVKVVLISLGCLLLAVLIFFSQKNSKESPTLAKPEISSEVTGIKAIQTHPETGEVEYTLNAKSLTQNTDGTSILNEVVMDWTPNQGDSKTHYTIRAKNARLDEHSGDFIFENGFEFEQKTTAMTITGGVLSGNTKTKQLSSNQPLVIEQAGNTFQSKGFFADLATQTYKFHQIQMQFINPPRQDTPLF